MTIILVVGFALLTLLAIRAEVIYQAQNQEISNLTMYCFSLLDRVEELERKP